MLPAILQAAVHNIGLTLCFVAGASESSHIYCKLREAINGNLNVSKEIIRSERVVLLFQFERRVAFPRRHKAGDPGKHLSHEL